MASPEKPIKRMLSISEAEARDYKRMKSNTPPAKQSADQDIMEIDEPAAQNNISQSDQMNRPAYLDQTAPNESVYIPANVYKVLTLDGTVVETVQDPSLSAGDAVVVPGELEAAAQDVVVYTQPPRPKRGTGDYSSSLLLPPWFPREIRDQIWGYLAKFPRAITLVELGYVLHKHYSSHLRVCAFGAGEALAAQRFFIENGVENYHPRRLRDGDRTKVIKPHEKFAIADGFCIDPDTNERTLIEVPDTVLRFRQICRQVNEELTPIFFQQNKFAFLDAGDAFLKLEGLNKNAKKARDNSSAVVFDSGYMELIRTIRNVITQFSPIRAPLYHKVAAYLPLLWTLNINLRHDAVFMRFDSKENRTGKNPLSLAKGIPALAQAFNKHNGPCKEIRVVNINGTDLIKVLTINEDEWYTQKVDIDHAKAIGPVLRRNIFEVDEGWLSSVQEIDQWAKEKEKKRQERLKQEEEKRRKKEEEAKLLAKRDQEKLERRERRMKLKEERAKLKAKKDQKKPEGQQKLKEGQAKLEAKKDQVKQKVTKPSATDKAEVLAGKAAEKARDQERGYSEVQLQQTCLHSQALQRGNEGYRGIGYLRENDFMGPINLPRTYNTYEDWRAANGNVAIIDPPPTSHEGMTLLSNLGKSRIDNGYQEVEEGRCYRTILPKPAQLAPHAVSHGVQAQHNHGQNGNVYRLQTCGTIRFPAQNLQQTLGYNGQAQHIQAGTGQGMGFSAMGISSQPFQGQNIKNQGIQLQGFQTQLNYDCEVQTLARNGYINNDILGAHLAWYAQNPSNDGSMGGNSTNHDGMIEPPPGQSLFGAAANTHPVPAIQSPPSGLIAGQSQGPPRAPHSELPDGPPRKRHRQVGPLSQLAPAPPRNKVPVPMVAPVNPAAQRLPGDKGTGQKLRTNNSVNTQGCQAAQQGRAAIDLTGGHPHPVLRGPFNAAANTERRPTGQANSHNQRLTHNQSSAQSNSPGTATNPRPAPAAQNFLVGPFNPLPGLEGRGNDPENAPNGYGGFSIRQPGGGPSQDSGNNNNNSSDFKRQS